MNDDKPIDKLIYEYYSQKHIPNERLSALKDLARQSVMSDANSGNPTVLKHWPRRLLPILSAAASIMLTLFVVYMSEKANGPLFASPKQSQAQKQPIDPSAFPAPQLMLLRVHADWCRPSIVMAPRCSQLKDRYDSDDVLFVDFDITNADARRQSELLAYSLGLVDIWERQGGISGEAILVDAQTKVVLSVLTQEDEYEKMTNVVLAALTTKKSHP